MVQTKNIEALSLVFTFGIAAGGLLSTGACAGAAAVLLPLTALPVLMKKRILQLPEQLSTGLILAAFALLGCFCMASAGIPAVSIRTPLQEAAARSGEAMRRFIGTIPFPSEGTAPLLLALLTGERSGLTAETTAIFRDSGASHLLALSGLHIGIIYLIFDRLTRVMGHSPAARRIRYGFIVGAAGFYTLMAGAGPSLVRAFLFILINETLALTLRPRKASRVLCLALFIQLALNPASIRSLGFQLSYLAMCGIFFLYPVLEKWYPAGSRLNPLRRIWQAAALSISCQVFTAPLVWLRFHSFPRYFLLTNLLAIPLTTLLIGTALLTLGLSALGLCPGVLVNATDLLCSGLVRLLELIASM